MLHLRRQKDVCQASRRVEHKTPHGTIASTRDTHLKDNQPLHAVPIEAHPMLGIPQYDGIEEFDKSSPDRVMIGFRTICRRIAARTVHGLRHSVLLILGITMVTTNAPSNADLRTLLNGAENNSRNIAGICQQNMLQGNYRGKGLYKVTKGEVYMETRCSSGSSGGVGEWQKIASLDVETVEQCMEGHRRIQWSIRDNKLIQIVKLENCSNYFMNSVNNIYVDETAYPIRWRCQDYSGYNPDNLAKECFESQASY